MGAQLCLYPNIWGGSDTLLNPRILLELSLHSSSENVLYSFRVIQVIFNTSLRAVGIDTPCRWNQYFVGIKLLYLLNTVAVLLITWYFLRIIQYYLLRGPTVIMGLSQPRLIIEKAKKSSAKNDLLDPWL